MYDRKHKTRTKIQYNKCSKEERDKYNKEVEEKRIARRGGGRMEFDDWEHIMVDSAKGNVPKQIINNRGRTISEGTSKLIEEREELAKEAKWEEAYEKAKEIRKNIQQDKKEQTLEELDENLDIRDIG